MSYEEINEMMLEMGLPFAYHHFAEGESPKSPFLIFLSPGKTHSVQITSCITVSRSWILSCTPMRNLPKQKNMWRKFCISTTFIIQNLKYG